MLSGAKNWNRHCPGNGAEEAVRILLVPTQGGKEPLQLWQRRRLCDVA
jgi:hypothetical protein